MKHILKRLYVSLLLLVASLTNIQAQILEKIALYADDEGAPARFDHINFSISYAGWMHDIKDVKQKAYSIGFDLGIYKDIPLSPKGNVSFAIGVNYSSNNVHHNANIYYLQDSTTEQTRTELVKANQSFSKNKLFSNYIEMPLELRFRKLGKNKFRFYPGFKIGTLMRVTSTRSNAKEKTKIYRIKNTNVLRYGPTLKFGYGKWNVYGFYSLSTLFDGEDNSQINPFNVGLTFFVL